jgi:hypothetical protein
MMEFIGPYSFRTATKPTPIPSYYANSLVVDRRYLQKQKRKFANFGNLYRSFGAIRNL